MCLISPVFNIHENPDYTRSSKRQEKKENRCDREPLKPAFVLLNWATESNNQLSVRILLCSNYHKKQNPKQVEEEKQKEEKEEHKHSCP